MNATLDIELLRTFHAVARIGKFSAAAQHLHKSPAAISVHVQRLEAIAGGRLLERDNQSVALTALGERLLSATAELLHSHDKILADLKGAQLSGRIKLGVPEEFAAHVIRDILPEFTAHWPGVILEVCTAPSYTLLERIQRGKLHMAITVRPQGAHGDGAQRLVSTQPVWVAALAGQAQYQQPLPVAVYAADCSYSRALPQTLRASGRAWRTVLDSESTQAIGACVEAGLAVALMDRAQLTPRMVVVDDLPTVAEHEVVLVRAEGGSGGEAGERLANLIAQRFRL
ncbi:LysR family transcriptional regulator [Pseudomonas sp. dw_358]|uniref:LysR family transcriptional regulator n=1 Tax=Pseudomonas sp. dw_358 TaxID=2720083 RepID=UPI001BD2CE31|nr:LysR family transcriptional regulator [Pseudomonas sp. dw_358]